MTDTKIDLETRLEKKYLQFLVAVDEHTVLR